MESENQDRHLDKAISSLDVLRRHERAHSYLLSCHRVFGNHPYPSFPFCVHKKIRSFLFGKVYNIENCQRAQTHLTGNQWWLLKYPAILSDYVAGNKNTWFLDHNSKIFSNSKIRHKELHSSPNMETWVSQFFKFFILKSS